MGRGLEASQAAPERVATAHLVGRRPSQRDRRDWCALLRDPRVAASLGCVPAPAAAERAFAANLAHWRQHGFGQWAWRAPAGTFAARGGLRYYEPEGERVVELGYSVASPLWGRGLSTEIARAAVAVGFQRLGLAEIVAFTRPDNEGSRRVMEKAGFRYERVIRHGGLPHVLYVRRAAP
jgi:RimJ/RimL family protein N-acetyltransferase